MALILMYNPGNQHIMEAEERDMEKLANSGFRKVERYDLVAIYHPALNQHKTVLRADLQTWLNLGYYSEPTIVYHPEKGSRQVSADDAKELYKQGWYDTPAKFPTSTLVGMGGSPLVMPAAKPEPVQGDKAEQAATASIVTQKPLVKMNKTEIAQAYFDTFGKTLDAELTKEQMIAAYNAEASAASGSAAA